MERDFRFSSTPDKAAAFQDGTNLSLPQHSSDTSVVRPASPVIGLLGNVAIPVNAEAVTPNLLYVTARRRNRHSYRRR